MKKLLIILLSLLMLTGCAGSNATIEEPEPEPEPIGYSDPIYIVTTKSSSINTIEDLADKKLAIQTNYDKEKSDFVVDELTKAEINPTLVEVGSYQDIPDFVKDKKIDAWIIDGSIHDDDLLYDFRHDYEKDNYKVVAEYKIPIYEEETLDSSITSNKLFNKPFIVMLNGLDENVDPDRNDAARNDVNIVLVVDPVKRHVLTVSFPRDSYVYMPTLGYSCKLSEVGVRASWAGVDESEIRNSIGYALDVDIPYFVQVSFGTFVNMINSLGGVYIDVPYDVYMNMDSNRNVAQPYEMSAGYKNVLGEWALALARNRKYAGIYNGDYGRIRNQTLIVNSVFKRIAEHPFILKWAGWTWMAPMLAYYNFTDDELKTLFALAGEFSKGYTIDNYFIENTGGTLEDGTWIGYMVDYSVQVAKGKVNLVLNGEVDEDSPYYEDIMTGYVSGGASTTGYVGEEYDLREVYPD